MYTLTKCISRIISIGYTFKYIMLYNNKLRPDLFFTKFSAIDVNKIKAKGIKYIVIDKDNTITLPLTHKLYNDEIKQKINEMKNKFGNKNIIIVSNSIYDKKQKHFNLISQNLGLTILEHKMPKPFIKKKIFNYFNINHKETHKVAIIGDRILVDVLTAKTNSYFSILVNPISVKSESFIIKLIRKYENKYKH